jgi:hypothetical protein
MKRMTKGIIGALVLTVVMISAAWAVETTEEKNVGKEAAAINKTSGSSQGQKVVAGRLEKEFSVTDTQIQGLRNQKMGYGEVAIVFSLASKMPGGITAANINQIVTLRQGSPRMGWGEVSHKLGIKLGPTVSRMRTMNREMHGEMRRESKTDKGSAEMNQESDMKHDRDMMGNEGVGGMGGGGGMSHGNGR